MYMQRIVPILCGLVFGVLAVLVGVIIGYGSSTNDEATITALVNEQLEEMEARLASVEASSCIPLSAESTVTVYKRVGVGGEIWKVKEVDLFNFVYNCIEQNDIRNEVTFLQSLCYIALKDPRLQDTMVRHTDAFPVSYMDLLATGTFPDNTMYLEEYGFYMEDEVYATFPEDE